MTNYSPTSSKLIKAFRENRGMAIGLRKALEGNKLLVDFLRKRDGIDLEFKKAKGGFPKGFWETYSAFANTQGGTIICGIAESKGGVEYAGLSREEIDKLVQDFWNSVNNPDTISCNLLREQDVYPDYERGYVAFYVRKASVTERPVFHARDMYKGSYKRCGEGDYRCSREEVAFMQRDALIDRAPYDRELLPNYTVERDLDTETLKRYRQLFAQSKPYHVWSSDSDEVFLRKVGVARLCRDTDQVFLTRAGLLLLGKYQSIVEAFPGLILDYREQDETGETRWLDRLTFDGTWAGNLLSFYLEVYPRLRRRLAVPFRVEQSVRRDDSPEHQALREALVNTLVHADYARNDSIVIEVSKSQLRFTNPGDLLISLAEYYRGGYSKSRNPLLQQLFAFIGLSERAGSGVTQILKGWQSFPRPELTLDQNPTRITLSFSSEEVIPSEHKDTLIARFGDAFLSLSQEEKLLLTLTLTASEIRHKDACNILPNHKADVSFLLRSLRDRGFLISAGQGKGVIYQLGTREQLVQQTLDRGEEMKQKILLYCREPRTLAEIMEHIGLKQKNHFRSQYIIPLIKDKRLALEYPDKPKSSNQRYYSLDT